jgi:hypothetical protein
MFEAKAIVLGLLLVPGTLAAQDANVSTKIACATCSIDVSAVVRLVAPERSGTSFTTSSRVVRAQDGGYYVSPLATVGVMVFDRDGRYVKVIASQEGKGPGEMGRGGLLHVQPGGGDTLVIYDQINSRRSVFLRSGQYLASSPVPRSSSYVPMSGGRLAFFRSSADPAHAGLTIHVADSAGANVKSFGLTEGARATKTFVDDRLVAAFDGTFWSIDMLRFAAYHWDVDGRHLGTLRQQPSWFKPFTKPDPTVMFLDMLTDIRPAQEGIWMLVGDYLDVPPEKMGPNGPPISESTRMYDSVLQLVDTDRHEIIASRRIDVYVSGFVQDPLDQKRQRQMYRVIELPDGDLVIDISGIALRR